jgi:hypothetical protein
MQSLRAGIELSQRNIEVGNQEIRRLERKIDQLWEDKASIIKICYLYSKINTWRKAIKKDNGFILKLQHP